MGVAMRVNLGSGWHYREGWVNVDLYAKKADLRADLRTVDFPAGSVEEVTAIHSIEHLEREDSIALFRRIFRWLTVGGTLRIEMPERGRCLKLLEHDAAPLRLAGAKGLMGGRSDGKDEWRAWLIQHADQIMAAAENNVRLSDLVPDRWREPGAAHLHVWGEGELLDELMKAGFSPAQVVAPTFHGGQKKRDCAWVATRPRLLPAAGELPVRSIVDLGRR